MYLWWSLCTLYLHACRVIVTVGNSDLCCCTCIMYFECWLALLCVDPGLILFQIHEKSSWYQSCISHHIRLPVYEVYLMKMNVLIKASIKIIQPTITLFCSHHDLNPITPIVPGTRASPPGLSWHRSGPSVACPVLSSLLHPDPLPQQQSSKLQVRTKDKRDVRGPVDNKPQCFVFQICVSPGSTSSVDGGSI